MRVYVGKYYTILSRFVGWKGGGGEPAATQDDVWAQVKFSVSILCMEFSVYYV